MLLREELEKREFEILSEKAAKSAESKGRMFPEEKCNIRTDFQRDRDRSQRSNSAGADRVSGKDRKGCCQQASCTAGQIWL